MYWPDEALLGMLLALNDVHVQRYGFRDGVDAYNEY
jgi:hypothetical protein